MLYIKNNIFILFFLIIDIYSKNIEKDMEMILEDLVYLIDSKIEIENNNCFVDFEIELNFKLKNRYNYYYNYQNNSIFIGIDPEIIKKDDYKKHLYIYYKPILHELTHCILWHIGIENSSLEAVNIHEFYAYLASSFLTDNNTCIGQEICEYDKFNCHYYKKYEKYCIADIDNDLNIADIMGKVGTHDIAEILASTIIDLHQKYHIDIKHVKFLFYKSFSYIEDISDIKNIDFGDLIQIFLNVDHKYYKNKYSCKIVDAFKKRGFKDYMDGIKCKTFKSQDLQIVQNTGCMISDGNKKESIIVIFIIFPFIFGVFNRFKTKMIRQKF